MPRVSVSRFALHAGLVTFRQTFVLAALVANCLLPGAQGCPPFYEKRAISADTSRYFELAYGRRLQCLLNARPCYLARELASIIDGRLVVGIVGRIGPSGRTVCGGCIRIASKPQTIAEENSAGTILIFSPPSCSSRPSGELPALAAATRRRASKVGGKKLVDRPSTIAKVEAGKSATRKTSWPLGWSAPLQEQSRR